MARNRERRQPEPPRRPVRVVERLRLRFALEVSGRRRFIDELEPDAPQPEVGGLWAALRTRGCDSWDDFRGGLVFEVDGEVWPGATTASLDYVDSWVQALTRVEGGPGHVALSIYGASFVVSSAAERVTIEVPPPWPPPRKRASAHFERWAREFRLWEEHAPPGISVRHAELREQTYAQLRAYERIVAALLRQAAFDADRRRGIERYMVEWCAPLLASPAGRGSAH